MVCLIPPCSSDLNSGTRILLPEVSTTHSKLFLSRISFDCLAVNCSQSVPFGAELWTACKFISQDNLYLLKPSFRIKPLDRVRVPPLTSYLHLNQLHNLISQAAMRCGWHILFSPPTHTLYLSPSVFLSLPQFSCTHKHRKCYKTTLL